MIKAVIFDVGSVLVGSEWKIIYKKIAEKTGLTKEKVENIIFPLIKKWEVGGIDENQVWKSFEAKIDKELSADFKKNLWFHTYVENVEEIEGSFKILKELKSKGKRLALVTNTNSAHYKAKVINGTMDKIKKVGIETIINSHEAGLIKPDLEIYRLVLDRLNLRAEECLFIDDKEKNVKAAEEVGMEGIKFENPPQLRKELTKMAIL